MLPSPAINLTIGSCENLILLIHVGAKDNSGVGMYELEKSGKGYSRWTLYKSRDALLALGLIERAPATHLARKPYRLTQRGKEVVVIFEDAFARLSNILDR